MERFTAPLRLGFLLLALAGTAAQAQVEDALQETQMLLTNPGRRQKAIEQGGGAAAAADQRVQQLPGGAGTADAIYGLSAQIMADMVAKTGGDPEKLNEMLRMNPEAFANGLTPAQKAQVKAIADQMQGKGPASAP